MRKKWIFLAPLALLGIAIFIAIGGEVVLHLWNWLQAVGLLALCRILFGGGGFGGRGFHRSNFRRRMAGRWEQMTPEERDKFRRGMRSGCGGFGAPTSGTRDPA